jgi:exodeoxyribonuclease-3
MVAQGLPAFLQRRRRISMKVATWNVNSLKIRLPQVCQWLAEHQPDLLALQETKVSDQDFPLPAIEAAGYHAVFSGQRTYNGVAILTKQPPLDPIRDIPQLDDPARRLIGVTLGEVRVLNLYVVNGQEVGSEKFHYKLHWLAQVTDYLRSLIPRHPYILVMGDFNIAPEDRDVYDPAAWRDKIHCSTQERKALETLLGLGFTDLFRLFPQPERSYSWWDYRAASFRRNLGLRLDLILATARLRRACTACTIDKTPRGWQRPSDHTPVMAEFALETSEQVTLQE